MILEANMVDLNDEEIKDAILYLWEAVKNLKDEMKKDPELQQMQERLKQYKKDNFMDEIKTHEAKLKAARAQAKVRGIKITLPGDVK